jgi:hypothetical protein
MIKHRITDLEYNIIPENNKDERFIQNGRIDILYWVIQNNELKTEKQIHNRIKRIQEEILSTNQDMSKGSILDYQEKSARIEELKSILK